MGLTIGEYSARKFNFQNLNQTKESFDYIYDRKTGVLSEYFEPELFKGAISKKYSLVFRWMQEGKLKEKLDETLQKGFSIRHKVTHDANYLVNFDPESFSEIECVFQTVPQFLAANFAARYSQKRIVLNLKERYMRVTEAPTSDEKNFIFGIEDFRADYVILD